jgi:hypothetical protein
MEIDDLCPLFEVSIDRLRAENEGGGPMEFFACLVAPGVPHAPSRVKKKYKQPWKSRRLVLRFL